MATEQTSAPSIAQLASDLWGRIDTTADLVEMAEDLCAGGQEDQQGRVMSLLRAAVDQLQTLREGAEQLQRAAAVA